MKSDGVIEAPAPEQGLVRRCAIAALGLTVGEFSFPRTVRSPAFARRVDDALASADDGVPAGLRDAIGAKLGELGVTLPTAAAAARCAVDAYTLRRVLDGLDAALARTNDRIAAAYRAQGATAQEIVASIALEFDLDNVEAILAVARALDGANALLARTWEIADLRLALERELLPTPRDAAPPAGTPLVVAPQPVQPLPGRRKHFSASSLNLYADCPRKWYFRYLCGAVEDKPTSASAYGTAFHAALESFHHAYPKIAGSAPEELACRLEGEINGAFERHRLGFGSEVEYRLNQRRAHRTARKYLAWLRARAAKEPFEVIGCEIEADVALDGVEFRGYIDRVDRDERSGRVTVFDYKTGSIAASASEYRTKINASREFQLPYYYWAQTLAGETVRSLALVPLRDAHLDVDPIELEIVPVAAPPSRGRAEREATRGVISIEELERARTTMVRISRNLASGTIERFEPTDDPSSCRYCVYAPSCREKPPDDERPFAR